MFSPMTRLLTSGKNIWLLLAFLAAFECNAQEIFLTEPPQENEPNALLRPKLQLGFGHLSYFGDVGSLNGVSRQRHLNWGTHVMMLNPIGDAFELNVFALFGSMSAAERLNDDKVNFQTGVRMGGLSLSYNFHHLLPEHRYLTPFVSLGITTFEFNPKGNRQDAFGQSYHHWSDGSVRSLPETHPEATTAEFLEMDQSFETDLRSQEQGTSYALRAISIPVGAGVDIELTDKFNLRLAAEYHFTSTDYLDGYAYKANSQTGVNRNDRFLYSSMGITYNLHHTEGSKKPRIHDEMHDFNIPDSDEDNDKVMDFADICPFTPAGVAVDEKGCPVDNDKDGVPDYLDLEPNTAFGGVVNADGVALEDDHFAEMLKVYMGESGHQIVRSSTSTADVERNNIIMAAREKGYRFTIVQQGEFTNDQLAQILSIPKVKTIIEGGVMTYYAGDYTSSIDFLGVAQQLKDAGIKYAVDYNKGGKLTTIDEDVLFTSEDYETFAALYNDNEITFRVQIGAFSKAVSPKLFKDIPDVLVIPGTDGLTRYSSGAYSNIQDAAKHRVNLLLKGYEGAFVSAYRGGERISLKEAGATVTKAEDLTNESDHGLINPDFVKYAVQLGAFKGRIPAEILGEYMALGNVRPIRSDDGNTRYLYGVYDGMTDAQKAVNELKATGFGEIKIVGEFNGQIISMEEARKLKDE